MFDIFRAVRKFIELTNKYISNRNPLASLVLKFEALFSKFKISVYKVTFLTNSTIAISGYPICPYFVRSWSNEYCGECIILK